MGAIVALSVSSTPDAAEFVTGFHHALETAAVIVLVGAVIAFTTLKGAHHRHQEQESAIALAEPA